MSNQIAYALTEAEQAEVDQKVAELHENGYVHLAEYTYPRSGKTLQVGSRVRHRGQLWSDAILYGTGHVVALMHKPNSGWSRSWGMPDVELIVLRDREQFGSRLSQVAQYHVEVTEGVGRG
jgi:hypothetical protein